MDIQTKNKRDNNIDAIKGVAILLVIIGHILQYILYSDSFDQNIFFRIIYSFHMPLFMFVSGYVIPLSHNIQDLNWLKKRAHKLLIPFLFWIPAKYILKGGWKSDSFFHSFLHTLKSPDSGLWFLWVLFINCILLVCLTFLLSKFSHFITNAIYLNLICLSIIFCCN